MTAAALHESLARIGAHIDAYKRPASPRVSAPGGAVGNPSAPTTNERPPG